MNDDAVVVVSDEGLGGVIPFGTALRLMGFEPILLTGPVGPGCIDAWRQTYNYLRVSTNLYEPELLQQEAASIVGKHRLRGLFSCFDGLSFPAARAAAQMSLPHPNLTGIALSRNKYSTRVCMRRAGLANPNFCLVRSEQDCRMAAEEVGFPAIIKPINGMASHLVQRADNEEELRAAYRYIATHVVFSYRGNYGRPLPEESTVADATIDPAKTFLVERFVPGTEYSAEVLVRDRRITRIALFEKVHVESKGFLECIFAHPISRTGREEPLWNYIQKVLETLDIDNTTCHIEVIDGSHGPVLVENNVGRAGGQILVRAVKRYTGIDLISEILAIATGQARPEPSKPDLTGRVATLTVFPGRSGKIASISGLEGLNTLPGVQEVVPFCKVGDEIDVEDKEFFALNLLAGGLDNNELLELHRRVNDMVNFAILPRQGNAHLPEARMRSEPKRLDHIKTRSLLLAWIRAFFETRGFLEVQTPILHEAPEAACVRQCETVSVGGRQFYLRTDPEEYLKRYLTAGLEAVFEIAANVRAEVPDDYHLHEFTSVECYRAAWTFNEALSTCVELVSGALEEFRGTTTTSLRERQFQLKPPLPVRSFRDIVLEATGIDEALYPDAHTLRAAISERRLWAGEATAVHAFRRTWLESLLNEHVLPALEHPVIITDFPIELGLSARARSDDSRYCLRAEFYLPGGLELAHIYENLTDAELLRVRYHERIAHRIAAGLPGVPLDEGLLGSAALGMPPMSGFALGIDRLLLLILGSSEVGDGLLFPREGFGVN